MTHTPTQTPLTHLNPQTPQRPQTPPETPQRLPLTPRRAHRGTHEKAEDDAARIRHRRHTPQPPQKAHWRPQNRATITADIQITPTPDGNRVNPSSSPMRKRPRHSYGAPTTPASLKFRVQHCEEWRPFSLPPLFRFREASFFGTPKKQDREKGREKSPFFAVSLGIFRRCRVWAVVLVAVEGLRKSYVVSRLL